MGYSSVIQNNEISPFAATRMELAWYNAGWKKSVRERQIPYASYGHKKQNEQRRKETNKQKKQTLKYREQTGGGQKGGGWKENTTLN